MENRQRGRRSTGLTRSSCILDSWESEKARCDGVEEIMGGRGDSLAADSSLIAMSHSPPNRESHSLSGIECLHQGLKRWMELGNL